MQLTPEQVQSINILLSAVQVAQQRGAFSLQDAHTLQEAIDRLVPREEQGQKEGDSELEEATSVQLQEGEQESTDVVEDEASEE
tara:strand:- start:844 stop:1095 length:252 start_codon:yes stop_codon:yes gene_type:complete